MKHKNILFAIILAFLGGSCTKKQLNPKIGIKNTATIVQPNRLGLGDMGKPLTFSLYDWDAQHDIDAGEYTFVFQIAQEELLRMELEKLPWGDWITASGTYELQIPIHLLKYADGVQTLKLKVFENAVLVKESTFSLHIEKNTIRTASDFIGIRHNAQTLAGNYVLGGDIDLTAVTKLLPLVTCSFHQNNGLSVLNGSVTGLAYDSCIPFSGTFNGRGFTLRGIKVGSSEYLMAGVGLFGVIDGKTAQVKNISLAVMEVKGSNLVGALAGLVRSDAMFSNIKVFVDERSSSDTHISATDIFAGGVFGCFVPYSLSSPVNLLQNITANLNVSAQGIVGGIAGALLVGGEYLHAGSKINTAQDKQYLFYVAGTGYSIGGIAGELVNATLLASHAGVGVSGNNTGKNVGGLVGNLYGVHAKIVDSYHFSAKQLANNDTELSKMSIKGNQYVGGIVGQMIGVSKPALVRVFVDSYQITGNDQVHIFCPEQTQGYVQNSFYSSSFAPQNFPSAQNVLHLSKEIAKKQDFIALGFDFINLWQWGQTQNGFPFF